MARPKRRWYQFRLRTLLVVMTAVALVFIAYGAYIEPYTQQRRAMEVIAELNGTYQSSGPTAWQRRLFGEDHQNLIVVDLRDSGDPDRYVPYLARLPAIETLVVGGDEFGDGHLRRLSGLSTLKALMLDSTSVTDEALAAWQERWPEVAVHRSPRRAIRQLESAGWSFTTTWVLYWTPWSEEDPLSTLANTQEFFIEARRAVGQAAKDEDLAPLRHVPTLRTLWLRGSKITGAGLRHLRHLPHLDYLDLGNTPVTSEGLSELKHLPNLVYLDLSGTQVADGDLEHLGALPKLGWLNLNRTLVSHAGIIQHVAPIKSLRMICLERTRVSPAESAALNEMLRPCVVFGGAGKAAVGGPDGNR
jgi:hypothetical protein